MSVNNVNPGTFFAGTWEAWGTGRVPIGVDPEDADFSKGEMTGGSKTIDLSHDHMVSSHYHTTSGHALTLEEIPAHAHGENISYLSDSDTGTSQSRPLASAQTQADDSGKFKALNVSSAFRSYIEGQLNTDNAGGGQSHTHGNTGKTSGDTSKQLSESQSILPQYITCYMWKRTA